MRRLKYHYFRSARLIVHKGTSTSYDVSTCFLVSVRVEIQFSPLCIITIKHSVYVKLSTAMTIILYNLSFN